jgi:DNA-binding MurR/RpiR family transcriptional regulator
MSCLVKIRALKEQLSPNEKKIARFILDNPALIRDYSSQNLAASVGVSQSSVVKFSQKLGYRGFIDLKLAIHEAVLTGGGRGEDTVSLAAEAKTEASAGDEMLQIKSRALHGTLELNDEGRLLEAADVLHRSNRIQIIALGSGSLVARNFASVLIQIGKSVVAEVDTYIQLSSVATLGKGDAVFLISFSGESPRMLQIVKQARKAGVTIITLTGFSANPIRSLADVELYCMSRLGAYDIPQIVSTTSQQFVVDVLFSLILKRDRKALELMKLSRQAVENI